MARKCNFIKLTFANFYSARSPWALITHQLMNVPMEQKGISWSMRLVDHSINQLINESLNLSLNESVSQFAN